jgi:hypothetical protein
MVKAKMGGGPRCAINKNAHFTICATLLFVPVVFSMVHGRSAARSKTSSVTALPEPALA